MPTPTPAQVDRLIGAIEYPADKQQVTQQAERKRTAKSLRSLLEQLPERTYQSPANVRRELEKLEPSLKAGGTSGNGSKPAKQKAEAEEQPSGGVTIPQPVREMLQGARVRGQRLVGEVGQQASMQADARRPQIADGLVSTATVLSEASTKFEESGQRPLAQAAQAVAARLRSASTYVRQTQSREMVGQVGDFAKERPLAVLASGIAVGVLVTRFVRNADLKPLAVLAPGSNGGASADAIRLLESDHSRIRLAMNRAGSAAPAEREQQIKALASMLEAHERMEEEIFYPELERNPATRQLVKESYAEHGVVDQIMSEIKLTDPNDEMWKARFTAMRENLEQHIDEEEGELLPLARKSFTAGELSELGRRMQRVNQTSPQMAGV